MTQSKIAPFFADAKCGLRLYCGDALELLTGVRDAYFDMVFADPPYFLSNGGITCASGRKVCVNKGIWDKAPLPTEIHEFNMTWLRECHRVLKPNGTIWVSGTAHNIYSVGFAMQELGYKVLNDIAWYKINPPPNLVCRYFTHSTETILWAKRNAEAKHLFHYADMKQENKGRQMQSLWHIMPPHPIEKRYGKHPTQKPEALLERIIRASTNPGDYILDPFCGSATTGVVAARLGRRFVGFDLETEFLEIGARRMEDETASILAPLVYETPALYDVTLLDWSRTSSFSCYPSWLESSEDMLRAMRLV